MYRLLSPCAALGLPLVGIHSFSTNWGCGAADLRSVYIAYVQAAALYGSEAYVTHASATTLKKVESAHAAGARVITGCTKDTRNDLALREANLMPISLLGQQAAAITHEKLLRLPADIPSRQVAEHTPKVGGPGFRDTARSVVAEAELTGWPREELLMTTTHKPWDPIGDIKFNPDLASKSKRTDAPELRKAAAEEILKALRVAALHIYTDGSAKDGITHGGAGHVIYSENEARLLHADNSAAGAICGSYRAELTAIRHALTTLLEGFKEGTGWLQEFVSKQMAGNMARRDHIIEIYGIIVEESQKMLGKRSPGGLEKLINSNFTFIIRQSRDAPGCLGDLTT